MAESINCDICSKLATVHLTQIVNGKIHKIDLCETCAKEKGVTDPNGFSLADLLSSGVEGEDLEAVHGDLVCKQCGFTPEDYKKLGSGFLTDDYLLQVVFQVKQTLSFLLLHTGQWNASPCRNDL